MQRKGRKTNRNKKVNKEEANDHDSLKRGYSKGIVINHKTQVCSCRVFKKRRWGKQRKPRKKKTENYKESYENNEGEKDFKRNQTLFRKAKLWLRVDKNREREREKKKAN